MHILEAFEDVSINFIHNQSMAVAVLGKKYLWGLAPHHLGGNNG